MSLSLIAVFIPILLMGGIVGRLFREFAVTLSAAILVSLVVSLTHHADDVRAPAEAAQARKARPLVSRQWNGSSTRLLSGYRAHAATGRWRTAASCCWCWRHHRPQHLSLHHRAQRVLPAAGHRAADRQHPGRPEHLFPGHARKTGQLCRYRAAPIRRSTMSSASPAAAGAIPAFMFIVAEAARRAAGLRRPGHRAPAPNCAASPAPACSCSRMQDIRVGGRASNAQYQYTLQADDLDDLRTWEPRIREALSHCRSSPTSTPISRTRACRPSLVIDRDAAARLGISPSLIDATLNDVFGQRQVSTIYNPLNQYHVVMEAAPQYWQSPESLKDMYCLAPTPAARPGAAGLICALSSRPLRRSRSITRDSSPRRRSLSTCRSAFRCPTRRRPSTTPCAGIGVPNSVHGSFQGTAKAFQASLDKPAAADPGRAGRRLSRAGHALREPDPPAHHPVHAALGRRRRDAGADGFRHRVFASSR